MSLLFLTKADILTACTSLIITKLYLKLDKTDAICVLIVWTTELLLKHKESVFVFHVHEYSSKKTVSYRPEFTIFEMG